MANNTLNNELLHVGDFVELFKQAATCKTAIENFTTAVWQIKERKQAVGKLVNVIEQIAVKKCIEELVLADSSLTRPKTIIKANGALFAASQLGQSHYIQLYEAITAVLEGMSNHQFNQLRSSIVG